MKLIGVSINEAIDWAQDRLTTTRPLAERTLFSLLADKLAAETEDGFILLEDADDEPEKHHDKAKHQFSRVLKRYKFHGIRKHAKRFQRLDWPDNPNEESR